MKLYKCCVDKFVATYSYTHVTCFRSISIITYLVYRTRRIRFGASDGGDGGAGGGVVALAESSVRSLSGLKPLYRGRNGDRGSGGHRIGGTGRTAVIKVRVKPPFQFVLKKLGLLFGVLIIFIFKII